MARYAVTALGVDRPGIVAGLTWALVEAGGNLEDVSSTILHGRFTMMLVVDAPQSRSHLRDRLSESVASPDVHISVDEVDQMGAERSRATHALSVYGPDRPGIVAAISRVLADQGVNIADLTCRPVKEEGKELYSMLAEVAMPPGANADKLESELGATASELGVDIAFEPIHR